MLNSLEVTRAKTKENIRKYCFCFRLAEQLEQKTLDELDELEDEDDERVLQEYR